MSLKRSQIQPSTKPMNRHKQLARESKLRQERVQAGVALKVRYQRPMKVSTASSRQLSKWSKDVRERDNHICQRCGGVGEVAHHVAPRSRRPDLRLDRENGKTLCVPCHSWVHDNPKASTAAGWLSDVPYEMRDETRVKTEKLREAA